MSTSTTPVKDLIGQDPNPANLANFIATGPVADKVHFPDGSMLFVWAYSASGSGGEIRGQFLEPNGQPRGGEFVVNDRNSGTQFDPHAVLLDNGCVAIVWDTIFDGKHHINGRVLNSDGSPSGKIEFRVNDDENNTHFDASIAALPGGRFVVAWTKQDDDSSQTYLSARRFASDGNAIDEDDLVINTPPRVQPNVTARPDGNFMIVSEDYTSGNVSAYLYSDGISRQVNETNIGPLRDPDAADIGGHTLVVWYAGGYIGTRLYTPEAGFGPEHRIIAQAVGQPVVTALKGGLFAVAWTDTNGRFVSQLVTPDGEMIGLPHYQDVNYGAHPERLSITAHSDSFGDVFVLTYDEPPNDGSSGYDIYSYAFSVEAVLTAGSDIGETISPARGGIDHHVLLGRGGDDRLTAAGLSIDYLFGGSGNDLLYGRTSMKPDGLYGDDLNGGEGLDRAYVGVSGATFSVDIDLSKGTTQYYGAGSLTSIEALDYRGGEGRDAITGGAQVDFLAGFGGGDVLNGGGGGDILDGGAGVDVLEGGPEGSGDGSDVLNGGGGGDTLRGGAGDDRTRYDESASGVTVNLVAGTGTGGDAQGDTYVSIENANGSSFADTFVLDVAANNIDGRGERDTVSYVSSTAPVTVTLFDSSYGSGSGGYAQGDKYFAIENVTGSNFADTFDANNSANVLDGGGGADTMIGRAGNDSYLVDDAGDRVVEAAGGGSDDRVYASGSYALAAAQEVEVLATTRSSSTRAIDLTGNDKVQTLYGNAGTNILDGLAGADTMSGFGGSDSYLVDNAGDRVFESAGGGTADRVYASVSYGLAGGQEIEVLATTRSSSTRPLDLSGNEKAQTLYGNAGANILDGKGGADTLSGFAGNDRYIVDQAADQIIEAAGGGADSVYARASYGLAAGQDIETLATINASGTTAINLNGNEKAQTLYGNAGANFLDGKGGSDVLYGLGGADTFLFSRGLGTGNVDRIADFAAADDTIRLAKTIFTMLPSGGLSQTAFKDLGMAGASVDANDRILYNHNTGRLSYDADGSGGGEAVLFAILNNKTILTFQDFFVA